MVGPPLRDGPRKKTKHRSDGNDGEDDVHVPLVPRCAASTFCQLDAKGASLPRPGFGTSLPGNHSAMSQAVAPRATVGPIGPRPASSDALRTQTSQRRAAATTVAVGALISMATLVLTGLLLTHVLANGPVGRWDATSTQWLATHRDSGLDAVTNVLSRSADTLGIIAAALVVAIVVGLRRRWDQLAILVTGLLLELSVFISVNAIVGRPRPSVERLGATPSTGSFPSGHTAATLVLYATIALIVSETVRALVWRALAWLAAVLMPVAVGFARVYRGFHHPTDVFFGVLLGCAALTIAVLAVRRWGPPLAPEETR